MTAHILSPDHKKHLIRLTSCASIAILASISQAATVYWNGGSNGASQALTTAASWSTVDDVYTGSNTGRPASGDAVVFDSKNASSPGPIGSGSHRFGVGSSTIGTASQNWVFSSMTFKGADLPDLTFDNSIASSSSGTYTTINSISLIGDGNAGHNLITLDNTYTGTVYFRGSMSAQSGNTAIALGFSLDGVGNLNVANAAATLRISPVISGSYGLTKTGDGTLYLSGTNTYTGNTYIKGGTVLITSAYALGDKTNITTIDNAKLQINVSGLDWASSRGVILTSAGSTIGVGSSGGGTPYNATINGVISGAGALNKTDAGMLLLTNINTYTGGTNILAGGISLTEDGSLATANINIASGATLTGDGTGIIHFNIGESSSDLITVAAGGLLDIANLNLDLILTGSSFAESYVLVSGGDYTGLSFAGVTGLSGYDISYNTDGITLVAAVPEVASLGLLAAGAGTLILRRRK